MIDTAQILFYMMTDGFGITPQTPMHRPTLVMFIMSCHHDTEHVHLC